MSCDKDNVMLAQQNRFCLAYKTNDDKQDSATFTAALQPRNP